MWNKLKNSDYFLSATGDIEVFLTNFVSVWMASFSKDSFLDCVKASNPDLDTDDTDVKNCKKMLMHPEYLKSERTLVTQSDDSKLLRLTIMGDKAKFGYPIHLELSLQEGSKEMKITHQLLTSIKDLRASERELKRLLEKKDKEIEEYKCEGGEIALRHLKTVPFDSENHTRTHKVYKEIFGTQEVPDSLLAKLVVKSEPDSQPIDQPSVPPTAKLPSISSTDIIKQEIKVESSTASQASSTTSQSSSTISDDLPKKKQRRKLNI